MHGSGSSFQLSGSLPSSSIIKPTRLTHPTFVAGAPLSSTPYSSILNSLPPHPTRHHIRCASDRRSTDTHTSHAALLEQGDAFASAKFASASLAIGVASKNLEALHAFL
jgi:hypothetical protein